MIAGLECECPVPRLHMGNALRPSAAVEDFAQHPVSVAAEARHGANVRVHVREAITDALDINVAEFPVRRAHEVFAFGELRVGAHDRGVLHGVRRNTQPLQLRLDVERAARASSIAQSDARSNPVPRAALQPGVA